MSMKSLALKTGALALAAGIAFGGAFSPADAAGRVKVGVLSCTVSPGVGMLIGSSKRLSCDFQPSDGRHERYSGRINKLGLDVGFTTGGVLVWGVFAPAGYSRHALAGHYGGASAEASLVAGVGANALVGGSNRSFTLQPFSVQGNTGVNLAAGITSLDLYASK
ncbi:MAG TPA: DUF992 domain-containing protein [Bauldia sp.]|nr:DUF992 domain-containing protein [Bauldia sp.]